MTPRQILKKHLTMVQTVGRSMDMRQDWDCKTIEELVLKYGEFYKPRPLPKEHKPGGPKLCFVNAFNLASKHSLQYVEGFAMGVIPVIHAWCVDKDGFVIDPTWTGGTERAPLGMIYMGIPIKMSYVHMCRVRSGYNGVLDNYFLHYEVIRGMVPKDEWCATGEKHAKN